MRLHFRTKAKIMLAPGLIGFFLFYVVPFVWSMYYAVIDNNFSGNYVGMDNVISLFGNEFYLLALRNTLIFTVAGVVLILLFSLIISVFFIYAGKAFAFLRSVFILPMLIPTAGVAMVWRDVFNYDNSLTMLKFSAPNFFQTIFAPQLLPLYLIFLWKYSGLIIILFTGAISGIDKEIYEAAALDGAKGLRLHTDITAPLIRPTVFFALILSAVNSFNIYKEVYYLFGGDYPPDAVYLLQHFMNNHYRKLNYQLLSAGAVVFALILASITAFLYYLENRRTSV